MEVFVVHPNQDRDFLCREIIDSLSFCLNRVTAGVSTLSKLGLSVDTGWECQDFWDFLRLSQSKHVKSLYTRPCWEKVLTFEIESTVTVFVSCPYFSRQGQSWFEQCCDFGQTVDTYSDCQGFWDFWRLSLPKHVNSLDQGLAENRRRLLRCPYFSWVGFQQFPNLGQTVDTSLYCQGFLRLFETFWDFLRLFETFWDFLRLSDSKHGESLYTRPWWDQVSTVGIEWTVFGLKMSIFVSAE
jgi:hypothetical protein